MSVPKNLSKWGALVALETTAYNSGTPALSASTDGFKVYDDFEVEWDYLHDGKRDGKSGNGMQTLSPVFASGRGGKVNLVHYMKGAGAAYSASVRSSVDRMLRMMGMGAVFSGGGGAEIVTYSPFVMDGTLTSGVAELYRRGQKYNFSGAYVNKLVIESKGHLVPKWTFSLAGVVTAVPADAAVPAITYPGASIKNAKATNINLTQVSGGQTLVAKIREWTFTAERELVARSSQNESANALHPGLMLGDWKVGLSVLMESTADVTGAPFVGTTAIGAYRFFEQPGEMDIDLNVAGGAAQYNGFKISASAAHLLTPPKEEREGPIALWGLDYQLDATTEQAVDPFTIVTA